MEPSADPAGDPAPRVSDLLVAVREGPEPEPEAPAPRERPVLPWMLALGGLLLAALLAGALVAVVLTGGDDETADRAGVAARNVDTTTTESRPASLTAGGEDLLGADERSLGYWVGDVAKGERLRVLSVVGARGLVVGTRADDRVYVEFGGGVGENEPGRMPKVGESVDLSGPLKAAPLEPERALELSGEAAEIVRERGAYVNADRLVPSAP